jgi:uncharacterized protein (DUF302 family)
MRNRIIALLGTLTLWLGIAAAAPPAVQVNRTDLALDEAYRRVYEALEAHQFWVVFEADLGARMARFKERWGEDYNRSGLSGAKSMVFCNIAWTNRIASADPDMLALCPLHLSLYARAGRTTVTWLRPSAIAQGSQAESQAAELERELAAIVAEALK